MMNDLYRKVRTLASRSEREGAKMAAKLGLRTRDIHNIRDEASGWNRSAVFKRTRCLLRRKGIDIIRMSPAQRRQERKLIDASRHRRPPNARQIVQARQRGYFGHSDMGTEKALKWVLPKHPHSMDVLHPKCHWCDLERRILAIGHMASVRPPPAWWKRFMEGASKEMGLMASVHGSHGWTTLRLNSSDGRWWAVNVTNFQEPTKASRFKSSFSVSIL